MREGSDTDVLHDDLIPLSNFMKKSLRVLATFAFSMFVPMVLTLFLVNPDQLNVEPTDNVFDVGLRVAEKYAGYEFSWGLMAGLLITISVIYSCLQIFRIRRRYGWTTISTPYELESLFAIRPIFGMPYVGYEPLEEIADMRSTLSESLLSLETLIEESFEHGIPRTTLVTSSRAAEGKSTLAIGLAATLARSRSVLLIDGDLRSPSIHHKLNLQNISGLSNLLSGDGGVVPQQASLGFDVIVSGPTPPNSAQLLNGHILRQAIEKYQSSYDAIIIDGPPVLGLADAVRISRTCELILYAIEANRTWVYHALGAIRRLGNSINIIPVVTKIPASQFGYTYGYGYVYKYDEEPS